MNLRDFNTLVSSTISSGPIRNLKVSNHTLDS